MVNQITVSEYEVLNKAAAEYLKNGKIDLKCPRCGKPLIYESFGSLEIIRCEDKTCVKSIRRGI
ncbi:MAG: hypothetical protein E7508_07755 [Ruminococcus sp.]|nr:hypothetical protein [Ruminococcus sp.]